jgi:drug/metabolite transporter superfamily protein YnfA
VAGNSVLVFVAGSLVWGVAFDGFRPGRWDIAGSAICLLGVFRDYVRPAKRCLTRQAVEERAVPQ